MNTRIKYSLPKLAATYSTWWLFWCAVQIVVLHHLELGWTISLIDSLVSNALLATVVVATIFSYRFYLPGKTNRLYKIVWTITIVVIFCVLLKWILIQLFSDNPEYLNFIKKSTSVRFAYALLTIAYTTLLEWMWNKLSAQTESEKRYHNFEQLVKEAELTKIRQQLQPHFLFNSLNSISALVVTKPTEARKMIHQLSDFLRGTLKNEQHSATLSEELDYLKLYLEIEKVRFGHRLTVDIHSQEESSACSLPSLLLQPIVENAIKFGLYDISEEITISLSTQLQGSYLFVEIKNPFDPQTQNANKGLGFGLSSIARRLHLLYARNDLLTTKKEGATFTTTLKIPQNV